MNGVSGTFGTLNIRAIKSHRKRDNRAEKLLEEIVTKTFQICQKQIYRLKSPEQIQTG